MNFLLAVMCFESSFKHIGTHMLRYTNTVHLLPQSKYAVILPTTPPESLHPEHKNASESSSPTCKTHCPYPSWKRALPLHSSLSKTFHIYSRNKC